MNTQRTQHDDRFAYDQLPGRVVFGRRAAHLDLAREVEALGLVRVMLVATPRDAALAGELAAGFRKRVAVTFDGVRPHVPSPVAVAAREAAAGHGADGILAVGGGSTTGTAKVVALTTGLPIVVVPTTYSGSEMTPVWGVTTDRHKQTGRSPRVLPRVVVYDPCLVEGLPVGLATASALNAMAHCVEALWAPGANPLTTATALEGARVLRDGLEATARGDGRLASERLLLGAHLAGSAFAVAGSGLHHLVCHVLGGAFGLAHAQTHAVVLPHVLALNAPGLGGLSGRLADALGGTDAVPALAALYRRVGAPTALAGLGLTSGQLEQAAALVTAELPVDNPVPVDPEGVRRLLGAAFGPLPRSA